MPAPKRELALAPPVALVPKPPNLLLLLPLPDARDACEAWNCEVEEEEEEAL